MAAPLDISTFSSLGLSKSKLPKKAAPQKADIPTNEALHKEKKLTSQKALFHLGDSPQEKALKPNAPRGTYLNILA